MQSGFCVRCITGSTHQASVKYSPVSRGKQCTPVSFFATLYTSVFDVIYWTSRTVDFVLDHGDCIYQSVPHQQEYFDYTELPLSVSFPPDNEYVTCRFGDHMSGFLHSATSNGFSLSFSDAIIAACEQALGYLVTVCQTCVAVVRHNSSYFLFDSHSHNSAGMPVSNGTAVLLEFSSLDSLCAHMRRLHAIADNENDCHCKWQQSHDERCQFDVIPVFSTVAGPAAQNVTGGCCMTPSYASVCKKNSPVRAASFVCIPDISPNMLCETSGAEDSCTDSLSPSESVCEDLCSDVEPTDVSSHRTEVGPDEWTTFHSRHGGRMCKDRKNTQQRPATISPPVSKFCCSPCGKEWNTERGLRLHQYRKHGIQSMQDVRELEHQDAGSAVTEAMSSVFPCHGCSKEFSSQRGLQMHIRCIHEKNMAGAAVTDQSHSNCRLDNMHKENQQTNVSTTDMQFSCTHCNKLFSTQRGVDVHNG